MPNSPALAGSALYAHAHMLDPAAVGGISTTGLLIMVLGY
jgi:hypothetical protein